MLQNQQERNRFSKVPRAIMKRRWISPFFATAEELDYASPNQRGVERRGNRRYKGRHAEAHKQECNLQWMKGTELEGTSQEVALRATFWLALAKGLCS